jgi:glycosyltransferase involved in cell wall biosynthesis
VAGPRRRPVLSASSVSCIVPTFDAGEHLAGALECILGQTHPPAEVLVVDDGSSDDTVAIARAWGDPVRVVEQPTAGPAATRNRGAAEATGDLLAFLDPDDRWLPHKLEVQVAHLATDPGAGGCVGRVRQVWADGFDDEAAHYAAHPRMADGGVPGYATTALLVRREAWAEVGPLDTDRWYSDATEWFMRARDLDVRIDLLEDVLTLHRLHDRNLTRRRPADSADEFLDLVHDRLRARRAGGG